LSSCASISWGPLRIKGLLNWPHTSLGYTEDKNVRRFTSFDTVHVRVELQGAGPPMTCLDKHSSTPVATRHQKEVGGQHSAPAALPKGKIHYPSYRRLVGPGAGRNGMENLVPPAFDSLTSLYVLCYSGRHSYCSIQIQGQVFFQLLPFCWYMRWGS